jgi:hypothetical protein
MSQRVMHMMMSSVENQGVITTQYWCYKIDRFLVDDPSDKPTPKEQAELDKQADKLRANPPPVCKRCRANKDRHMKEIEGMEDDDRIR